VGDAVAASREFGRLIERLAPSGDVLEIACGTGLWTQHLAPRARSLTALDSSPEMIELARCRAGKVAEFIVADIFEWRPPRRYDTIFFGFWLSHVPQGRFGDFWRLLDRGLAPAGRILFVDEGQPRACREGVDRCLKAQDDRSEGVAASSSEAPATGDAPADVRRRLRDGSIHRIVKVFHGPAELAIALSELAWSAEIELTDEGFIVGIAQRR
jgi:demethylmenaquinone methyltransferase/2-methoxy-6-polyprenyl-1,4-benzoquinol methylase